MPNMRRIVGLCICLVLFQSIFIAHAQDNLLTDPGFEGQFAGFERGDFTFPAPWQGWWTDSPSNTEWMNIAPNAYPHPGGFKRSGAQSQSVSRGSGTFTASVFQVVNGIPEGARLRASVWVFIENVNEAQPQVRIGIGDNTGGNVGGNITWSPWMKTIQSWQQMSVEAVVSGGSATVFLYANQAWPNDPNAVYFDDASLVLLGTGEAPTTGGGGENPSNPVPVVPTTAPRPDFVPFVNPQDAQDDGSIVHTVQTGDTFSSIAVAYGVPVQTLLELNGLTRGSILQVGQTLTIQEAGANPTETDATEEPVDDTSAPDSTEESVDEPTDVPTDEPAETDEPTPEFTPTNTPVPTETPIPASPTPAPTAPVAEGEVDENVDPTAPDATICVLMFQDTNRNRTKQADEGLVAGGTITVSDETDANAQAHATEDEVFCFEELTPGRYTIVATPPDGFGLTTPGVLNITMQPGARIDLQFGVDAGVEAAIIPTADDTEEQADNTITEVPEDNAGDLSQFSGLIILGIAGAVFILGSLFSLILRRR